MREGCSMYIFYKFKQKKSSLGWFEPSKVGFVIYQMCNTRMLNIDNTQTSGIMRLHQKKIKNAKANFSTNSVFFYFNLCIF